MPENLCTSPPCQCCKRPNKSGVGCRQCSVLGRDSAGCKLDSFTQVDSGRWAFSSATKCQLFQQSFDQLEKEHRPAKHTLTWQQPPTAGSATCLFPLVCLTFLRHVRPLRVGKLVLPHSDPPLHARRDGQAVVGVERRVSTQSADETQGVAATY